MQQASDDLNAELLETLHHSQQETHRLIATSAATEAHLQNSSFTGRGGAGQESSNGGLGGYGIVGYQGTSRSIFGSPIRAGYGSSGGVGGGGGGGGTGGEGGTQGSMRQMVCGQQRDPRFDDTLEKVKRALAKMKSDVT